jgi:hypothetical protein
MTESVRRERRWRVAIGGAVAVAALAATAAVSLPSTAVAATAQRAVSYHGYNIEVPASWPVYDLAKDPTRCFSSTRANLSHYSFVDNACAPRDRTPRSDALRIPATSRTSGTWLSGRPLPKTWCYPAQTREREATWPRIVQIWTEWPTTTQNHQVVSHDAVTPSDGSRSPEPSFSHRCGQLDAPVGHLPCKVTAPLPGRPGMGR